MEKRNKIIVLIISIVFVIFFVIAGTYAFWYWSGSDNAKKLVINTTGISSDDINYTEGASSFEWDFQATDLFCSSVNNAITFSKKESVSNIDLTATINMDVNSIGDNIARSDDIYWIITLGNADIDCSKGLSSDMILNYGTFKDIKNEDQIKLLDNIPVTTTDQVFTVWIWIDSAGDTISDISGETIDTNIWTEISAYIPEPESPSLDPGMIPVTIENDGTVTTISKNDPNWYDYSNKKWANVVLVDSDSRSGYLNTTGKKVEQSDILAYYVWIPRYKYKIWTTDATQITSPQTIDIVFEAKGAPVAKGKMVGAYMTHPAFIWDGKTVAGIWVGKFEPSPDPSSECYTTASADNCNNTDQMPRIVPDVSSLRYQDIVNQFKTSLKFANGSMSDSDGKVTFATNQDNIYGLNTKTNTTDSHMMKNSEWGAVAYLSHSEYGINAEVEKNANITRKTGQGIRGNSTKYGILESYPQSTTGNISGIFDMVGCAHDVVMSFFDDKNNDYFMMLPDSKYYDVYLSSHFIEDGSGNSKVKLCTLETCGGHALYETRGWYEDSLVFFVDSFLMGRGGPFGAGVIAGLYSVSSIPSNTVSGPTYSWRSVIITDV